MSRTLDDRDEQCMIVWEQEITTHDSGVAFLSTVGIFLHNLLDSAARLFDFFGLGVGIIRRLLRTASWTSVGQLIRMLSLVTMM